MANNSSAGSRLKASIAKERKRLADEPPIQTGSRVVVFKAVVADGGGPKGERWIDDEIATGEQIRALVKLRGPDRGGMHDVSADWSVIESWLRRNAPEFYAGLRPAASPEEVLRAVQLIGAPFPAGYFESMQLHDGQDDDGPSGLIAGWTLLPLRRVIREATMQREMKADGDFDEILDEGVIADVGVRKVWWHPGWVPVFSDGAANSLCLDLAPTHGGTVGQLIAWYHDREHRRVVARSFEAFIARAASWMSTGQVRVKATEAGPHRIVSLDYVGWKMIEGPPTNP